MSWGAGKGINVESGLAGAEAMRSQWRGRVDAEARARAGTQNRQGGMTGSRTTVARRPGFQGGARAPHPVVRARTLPGRAGGCHSDGVVITPKIFTSRPSPRHVSPDQPYGRTKRVFDPAGASKRSR